MDLYKETKDVLIEKLIKDISIENQIKSKINNDLLSDREILFNTITLACKCLYDCKKLPEFLRESLKRLGVKRSTNGWLYFAYEHTTVKFINVNAIFKNAYCKSVECHKSAYHFIIDYKLEDIKLKSGTLKPYDLEEGIYHSICTFKLGGEEYVFDGAHYLVMDKKFYYSLFQFQESQSLTREEVLKDRFVLAQSNLKQCSISTKNKYKPATRLSNLVRRFCGMGFLIYLYNREALIGTSMTIDVIEKENKKALKQLNKRIEEIYGEDARKF